jgi:hypothetical protein
VARRGLVLAAGVWSGQLLAAVSGDQRYSALLQPRRGHLLEVVPPAGMAAVRHGVMEAGYTKVGTGLLLLQLLQLLLLLLLLWRRRRPVWTIPASSPTAAHHQL